MARMIAAPTLAHPAGRFAAFLAAYLYQGLVAGFSLTALANHYAGLGLSAAEVGGHFALAGLPWAVQPLLWGPLLDRARASRLGRHRAWLIAGLLGAQAALALLLLVPDERSLGLVGAVFCLHSAFAALMDTAADRLILDHVPKSELGRTSACTRAGFVLGTAAGTLLFSWSLASLGFAASVRILLAASGLAGLLAVAVREAPGDALVWPARAAAVEPEPRRPLGRFLRRLLASMRRPRALRLLALCFSIDFSLALFEVRLGVALVQEFGWDSGALSRAQAGLGLLAGTLGALAVGIWADRAGPARALRGLLLACAAAFGGIALLIATGRAGEAGALILALASLPPALLVVALVPAVMGASRGSGSAATQFELYMAVLNLGSVAGAAAAGAAGPLLGLAGTAALAAAVFAAGTLLAARPHLILRPPARRRGIA
ncbi:MAG: MFS transporter [Methylobacterium sp.]|uniref:MFS transporter n=1 Tax=Methylobacterium sp. TaxID=409 RepID=UPI002584F914|nr:MFS transporter [Methylobacterium sp.]MBY0298338.1 MFS transporter [Methylobacterium sp.]